jgi:nucleotide-binding universal stress UspA family protein
MLRDATFKIATAQGDLMGTYEGRGGLRPDSHLELHFAGTFAVSRSRLTGFDRVFGSTTRKGKGIGARPNVPRGEAIGASRLMHPRNLGDERFGRVFGQGGPVLALYVLAAWLALGAIAVLVMRRRGHDPYGWALLFLFLGPIVLPAAISADRSRPPEPPRPVPKGELDVLVAHDGSPAAADALDAALKLMGSQMTSVTLATVVDVETRTTVAGAETERRAQERLAVLAGGLQVLPSGGAGTVVLHGDPPHALAQYAAENGYELIVVGGSGPGGVRVRRGSMARRLASLSPVPLFVGPNRQ